MWKIKSSRRLFFHQVTKGIGFLFSSNLFLNGCKPREERQVQAPSRAEATHPCEDMDNVSEADIALRNKLGYVKQSPIPDNQCQNCNLFLPPKGEAKCGGCMLFKGPVYPEAYCTYWAPMV